MAKETTVCKKTGRGKVSLQGLTMEMSLPRYLLPALAFAKRQVVDREIGGSQDGKVRCGAEKLSGGGLPASEFSENGFLPPAAVCINVLQKNKIDS